MEVGQQDAADLGWVEAGTLHRDQRRSPAVDEDGLARPGEVEAGLKPAPAPEGVTRTEKPNTNLIHPSFYPRRLRAFDPRRLSRSPALAPPSASAGRLLRRPQERIRRRSPALPPGRPDRTRIPSCRAHPACSDAGSRMPRGRGAGGILACQGRREAQPDRGRTSRVLLPP